MKRRTDRRRESGIALVVTLLVMVLLVTVVFEIFRAGSRAAATGGYGRDSIRAALLAEAGIAAGRIVLTTEKKDRDYDTLLEGWARPAPAIELGGGTMSVLLEDEERKINLNTLVMTNGIGTDDQRVAVFRRLLDILGADPSVADGVVDWLDADDEPRVGGAESQYYQSLPIPYRAKNDLFDTIEELRLVRGVTPELFETLRPFVTIHGSGKVNINTAPKEVLMALSAGKDASDVGPIDEAAANQIVEYRAEHPFTSLDRDQLRKASPRLHDLYWNTPGFRNLIDVKSTTFHARSTGNVGGTVRTVDAVGLREGNEIQWRSWRLE